jgi:hypothetical protein
MPIERHVDEYQVVAAKDLSVHLYIAAPADLQGRIAAAPHCGWQFRDHALVATWGNISLVCLGLMPEDAKMITEAKILYIGAIDEDARLIGAFRFDKA